MTDANYVDDLALLTNTPAQAESQLHSIEQAAEGTDFHVNANKTKYLCLKQKGAIFTISSKSLELIDQFTYLVSNISSTERHRMLLTVYRTSGSLISQMK